MNFTATDQQDPIDMFFSWIIYVVVGELQELAASPKSLSHSNTVTNVQNWTYLSVEVTEVLEGALSAALDMLWINRSIHCVSKFTPQKINTLVKCLDTQKKYFHKNGCKGKVCWRMKPCLSKDIKVTIMSGFIANLWFPDYLQHLQYEFSHFTAICLP